MASDHLSAQAEQRTGMFAELGSEITIRTLKKKEKSPMDGTGV